MRRKSATVQLAIRALRECICAIKSYHAYGYCPTSECAACEARKLAEEALERLTP